MSAGRDVPIYRRPGSGIWHLRRTIPTPLQRYFPPLRNDKPRTERSAISLGTRDEKAALKAAVAPWAEHRLQLDALTKGRVHTGAAKRFFRELFELEGTESELKEAAAHTFLIDEISTKLEIAELRNAADPGSTKAKSLLRENQLSTLRRGLASAKLGRLDGRHSLLRAIDDIGDSSFEPVLDSYIDQFAAVEPQPIDETPQGRQAVSELRDIVREEATAALTRALAALGENRISSVASPSLSNATESTPPLTVAEYYRDVFLRGRGFKTRKGQTGLSADGIDKAKKAACDFEDIMGSMRIASVSATHVRDFRGTLLRVPTSWGKRKTHDGKTMRQLIAEADAEEARLDAPVPRLQPRTVNTTLSGLQSIFAHAVDAGHLLANPTGGIRAEEPLERLYDTDFDIDDLNKLFASPWFSGAVSETDLRRSGDVRLHDHRYWAFLCMLFSGARVSELGGIRCDQVHIDDDGTGGFFEFDWTSGNHGRRLKNNSSIRIVPIHNELIRLGFIPFARCSQAALQDRLFPGWVPQLRQVDVGVTKNDYSSAPFLKRFKTYLKWLGIKRPGISVKSFRASWETATIGKGIDERALLKITGRAAGGELPSYLRQKVVADQLRPSVNLVVYDGLRISHLYAE